MSAIVLYGTQNEQVKFTYLCPWDESLDIVFALFTERLINERIPFKILKENWDETCEVIMDIKGAQYTIKFSYNDEPDFVTYIEGE